MQIDINEYAEGAILLDGLEWAIVGICEEFGKDRRIIYSKSKIITILMERDLMTESEAEEFYDFNILGLYAGENNPIFLDIPIEPVLNNNQWEYHTKEDTND